MRVMQQQELSENIFTIELSHEKAKNVQNIDIF